MPPRRRNRKTDSLRGFLSSCDLMQPVILACLLGIGLIFIYSTGINASGGAGVGFFYRQLAWIALGWCGYFLLANFPYRNWLSLSPFFYLICLVLLAVVLVFGEKIFGARRWLDLGIMNFQPAELTKLALILLLASLLARPEFDVNRASSLLLVAVLIATPIVLIFYEPDLGSASILLVLAGTSVFIGGLNKKYILYGGAAVLLLGTAFFLNEYYGVKPILKPYHRERIRVFFNPESDLLSRGYQQHQARLALGSGGWSGKGLGNGTQHLLGFLPQSASNNDFIFSVIAEETGFFGTLILLLLYLLLLAAIMRDAWNCPDLFGQMLAAGIAVFLFVHIFINISVNIGLTPVKGLSLPFVSYGGSFVLMCMAAMGIVQSIHRYGTGED